ncbi:flagellar motor protein MotB [Heyndrickxia coagulans]|uniref:OmpA/MotB domain protein n=1 Tax=Heyndrickxia coagulans 36D1 TaxID=345219 RepID=G2TMT5_HEYCO|nr:flagellar motor protein MotB [Heyndrickxia coagulans]AEP01158.1 OmpA/MotB domain protein [Heyndrickxia coagulans 36D1]
MSKKRKKRQEEEGNSEAWLLPYSDFLTLLLALFIVLFAMSSIDAQKFQKFSKVLNGVFVGGTSFFDYTKQTSGDDNSTSDTEKFLEQKKNDAQKNGDSTTNGSKSNSTTDASNGQGDAQLKETQQRINTYIAHNKLEGKFETSLTGEGLLITIRDNVLFDSGKAEVRKEDIKTAKALSNLLVMDPPRSIIVSGHTDNVPIHNSVFQSNWDLSVMRATNFLKIILENKNLNPKYFSAKGYGEYHPIASNDTQGGRAKNRRVEVLILPKNEKGNDW